jgi:galactokinase
LLACEALKTGDARTLGYLMNQAQAVFDKLVAPHSPEELKSPLLHRLLNYEPLLKYIYGGKGVGSHGDGTVQFVARSENDRDKAIKLLETVFPQMRCYALTIPSNNLIHGQSKAYSQHFNGRKISPGYEIQAI